MRIERTISYRIAFSRWNALRGAAAAPRERFRHIGPEIKARRYKHALVCDGVRPLPAAEDAVRASHRPGFEE
jgi:hypothetical protein